jgi:hypothetical protein
MTRKLQTFLEIPSHFWKCVISAIACDICTSSAIANNSLGVFLTLSACTRYVIKNCDKKIQSKSNEESDALKLANYLKKG